MINVTVYDPAISEQELLELYLGGDPTVRTLIDEFVYFDQGDFFIYVVRDTKLVKSPIPDTFTVDQVLDVFPLQPIHFLKITRETILEYILERKFFVRKSLLV